MRLQTTQTAQGGGLLSWNEEFITVIVATCADYIPLIKSSDSTGTSLLTGISSIDYSKCI